MEASPWPVDTGSRTVGVESDPTAKERDEDMDGALVVINGTQRIEVDKRLDIGRADNERRGVVGLDERDNGISRLTLTLARDGEGSWIVENRSAKTSLEVVADATQPAFHLRPGERHLIDSTLGIEVRGLIRTHRIDILVQKPRRDGEVTVVGLEGQSTFLPTIDYSEADLDALVAMFCGYLRPFPRRDPRPLSYADAGALLDLPKSTVRRRIEKIRERLLKVDIVIEGRHAAADLAEFVLAAGVIGPDDLHRIGESP